MHLIIMVIALLSQYTQAQESTGDTSTAKSKAQSYFASTLEQIETPHSVNGDTEPVNHSDQQLPRYTTIRFPAKFKHTLVIDNWMHGEGDYIGYYIKNDKGDYVPDGNSGTFQITTGPYKNLQIYGSWGKGLPYGAIDITFENGRRWKSVQGLDSLDTQGYFYKGSEVDKTLKISFQDAFKTSKNQLKTDPEPDKAVNDLLVAPTTVPVRFEVTNSSKDKIWAFVWEDDKLLGRSDQTIHLSYGFHKLRFESSGYEDLIYEITVPTDSSIKSVGMTARRVLVHFAFNTTGVTVLFSQSNQQKSQSEVKWDEKYKFYSSESKSEVVGYVMPGTYLVHIKKKGWEDYRGVATILTDGLEKNITLKAKPHLLKIKARVHDRNRKTPALINVKIENQSDEVFFNETEEKTVLVNIPDNYENQQVAIRFESENCDPVVKNITVMPGGSGGTDADLYYDKGMSEAIGFTLNLIKNDEIVIGACTKDNFDSFKVNMSVYQRSVYTEISKILKMGLLPPDVKTAYADHCHRLALAALKTFDTELPELRDDRFLQVARGALINASVMLDKPLASILNDWQQDDVGKQGRTDLEGKPLSWWLVLPIGQSKQILAIDPEDRITDQYKDQIYSRFVSRQWPTAIKLSLNQYAPESDLRLHLVPEGQMQMVANNGQLQGENHTQADPFYMAENEINVGQIGLYVDDRDMVAGQSQMLRDLMVEIPYKILPKGNNARPFDQIKPQWAMSFCNWLNIKCQMPPAYLRDKDGGWYVNPKSTGFRLPDTTQWQYAARYGIDFSKVPETTPWQQTRKNLQDIIVASNDRMNTPVDLVYFYRDLPRLTTNQGKPYPLGLHDLCGNVNELCVNWNARGKASYYFMGGAVDASDPNAVMPWSQVLRDEYITFPGFRVILPVKEIGLDKPMIELLGKVEK